MGADIAILGPSACADDDDIDIGWCWITMILIESIQNRERDRFQYFEKRDAGGKPLHTFLIPL
jgi:hypothetical protein